MIQDIMKKKLLYLLAGLLLCIMLGLGIAYYQVERFAQLKVNLNQEQLFTLPAGTNRGALATLMVEQNIIAQSDLLPWLLRLNPQLSHFRAGTYLVLPNMTVLQFLKLLNSGKEVQFSVQFIEGTRLKDWLNVLTNAPYIQHTLQDVSLEQIADQLGIKQPRYPEGWFYPDTYSYPPNTKDIDILKRAYQQMQHHLNKIWLERDEDLPYHSAYELLIMASIIEKETSRDDERKLVASVFINRLRKGMRLQTDPTVIYGMGDSYSGVIKRRDLTQATGYNTYIIDGLPPTPIAMPSLASLRAAAHPAESKYLYFVADGYGKHVFSTNLDSHNRAVQAYRKVIRSQ